MISKKQHLIKEFGFDPFEGSIIFERTFLISLALMIFVFIFNGLNIHIPFVNVMVNAFGLVSAFVVWFYVLSRMHRLILFPYQIVFALFYIVEIITSWERK